MRQWWRYGTVSLIATATSVTVLGVLVSATPSPVPVTRHLADSSSPNQNQAA